MLVLKNEKGQSLIQVVIATAMIGALSLVLLSVQEIINKQQFSSNLNFQVDTARRNIMQLINTKASWDNTVAANPALSCLSSPSTCLQGTTGNIFIIKDGAAAPGANYYNWTGTGGLTMTGAACSGFVAPPTPTTRGGGNAQCPLQFQVTWAVECGQATGVACGANPVQSKIGLALIYNPADGAIQIPFNSTNYSNGFYQGSGSTLPCAWTNVGGNLVETCGRVGVGLTNPSEQLDVAGNAYVSGFVKPNRVINSQPGSDSLPAYSFLSSPTSGINSPSHETLTFSTNAAERIRVMANGNVGIGTTSPFNPLEVSGLIAAKGAPGTGSYVTTQNQGFRYMTETNAPLFKSMIENQAGIISLVYRNEIGSYADSYALAFRLTGLGALPPPNTKFNPASGPHNWIEFFGGGSNNATDVFTVSNGSMYFKNDCIDGDYCTSVFQRVLIPSDRRLKDHFRPFKTGLDALNEIRPTFFQYNGKGNTIKDGKEQLGVIAQELEKVVPDLVSSEDLKLNKDDKSTTAIKKVNYTGLVFVVINAVQDLYKKLFGEQGVIQQLKNENKDLAVQVKELKIIVCVDHPKAEFCQKK